MRVFLDLDGVMADMEGHYLRSFGHKMDEAPSRDEMWANINGADEFFYNCPAFPGAVDFFKKLRGHYDVAILTAASIPWNPTIATQKVRWVKRHLSPVVMVIPTAESAHKKYFAQNWRDTLIDDYGQNCREWGEAGGVAIKHEGNYSETWTNLLTALRHRTQGLRAAC